MDVNKTKGWKILIAFFMLFPIYALGQSRNLTGNDITFISNLDGTKQQYVELLPKDFRSDKAYDLIIGLHGHGADRWQFVKDTRGECLAFRTIAADHDMIAVSPDYRAKTSWMGPAAEADLVQLIAALKSKYKVRRVFLIGASMGGTSALTFAALHPELLAGVTAMNAHANHLEYTNFQEAIGRSFGGKKTDIPGEYKKRSAEYWPERLTMSLGFTIGTTDTIVPPKSVIRLSGILKKLDQRVLLLEDQESGHTTSFENAMTAMKYMLKTVAENKQK